MKGAAAPPRIGKRIPIHPSQRTGKAGSAGNGWGRGASYLGSARQDIVALLPSASLGSKFAAPTSKVGEQALLACAALLRITMQLPASFASLTPTSTARRASRAGNF